MRTRRSLVPLLLLAAPALGVAQERMRPSRTDTIDTAHGARRTAHARSAAR